MNKKRALSIVLVLALIATSIPFSYRDVEAASATYDIEYAEGVLKENKASTDKSISDYFTVKKIVGTDGDDEDTLLDGCTITTNGIATIDDKKDIYIPASRTTKPNDTTIYPHTNIYTNDYSYIMEYGRTIQDNEGTRKIESYEITTSRQTSTWAGRPGGIMLPFYYVNTDELTGYFALAFHGTTTIQYTYAFVGAYREYSDNSASGNAVTFTTKQDDKGNEIAYRIKLKLSYDYSDDGTTIEAFTFSMIQCFDDNSTITVFDNVSFDIADVLKDASGTVGKNGFFGTNASKFVSGNITDTNCPTRFSSEGAVAGYISGTSGNSKNNYISEIKVSLKKTEDELLAEATKQLDNLYAAFVANPSYATVEAYLGVYNTLPDKTAYSANIQTINDFLKSRLVTNGILHVDKTVLDDYPVLLEHIWATTGKEATDNTSVNSDIYSPIDVVKTTAVFDKNAILSTKISNDNTNSRLFMSSEAGDMTTLENTLGVVFRLPAVTFWSNEEETETKAIAIPILNMTDGNYDKDVPANVVYKTGTYRTDAWYIDIKNNTEASPESYDKYQKVLASDYIAVELCYVTEEKLENEASKHSKLNLVVKMWADKDGNGTFEEDTDVSLLEFDSANKNGYVAIAHSDTGRRKLTMEMTKSAFGALVSIKMETPAYFLEKHAEVITKADGFVIDTYTSIDATAKTEIKTQIADFLNNYSTLSETVQKHVDVYDAYKNITKMSQAIATEDGLADKMQVLYDAFIENSTYDTAGAYFEEYVKLSPLNQSVYKAQMSDVYDWIYDGFENGLVLSMNKTALESYPNMLEYIWTSDGTFVNSNIYDSTDVVKTTTVFNKNEIANSPSSKSIYMFSGLADTSDTGEKINDNFGVTFANVELTYTTEAGGTSTVSVPAINASNWNLGTESSNVVYKSHSVYQFDQWAAKLRDDTASAPLSYDAYQKINSASYMAVELAYVATEKPNAPVPHTKIEFTAKMWTDDGDGIYEEGIDVLLIDVQNRTGDSAESAYLAIAYLNGAPRVRKAALTTDAFAALHSIQMERRMEYPTGDLDCNEVIDDTDADLLREYLVGLETTVTESAANVNERDSVDVCDLVALKVIIKKQKELP